MERIRIGFFDTKPYDREFFDHANSDYGFSIQYIKSPLSDETARLAESFQAVCVFVNDSLTETVVDDLVKLGVTFVALRCAGYNNVAFKHAYGRLHVARVPAYSPNAVAEHAAALMLTLNRKTHKAYFRTRDSNFTISGLMGFDLFGKTAGIIGTGRIGLCLIRILRGFGMNVLAYDRFAREDVAREFGFSYVGLDELFHNSDVISLHCPLTDETHHLINSNTIAKMKEGVFLINTGRGQLIDTKALIQGLKTKKVGAAGLDVYEEESDYFFKDFSDKNIDDDVLARLLSFNNVLITSHQGFFTKEALENIAATTLKNIADFFSGRPVENEICYKCAYGTDKECPRKTKGVCF